MKQHNVKAKANALRERLKKEGKSVRQLAEEMGIDYRAALNVLSGFHKGWYGEAHRAAVALGLK